MKKHEEIKRHPLLLHHLYCLICITELSLRCIFHSCCTLIVDRSLSINDCFLLRGIYYLFISIGLWSLDASLVNFYDFYLKYGFCNKVILERWNSDQLTTFTTYLSSLLDVIAEYNSNHAQKWGQICCESGQLVRVSFFRNDFVTKSIL